MSGNIYPCNRCGKLYYSRTKQCDYRECPGPLSWFEIGAAHDLWKERGEAMRKALEAIRENDPSRAWDLARDALQHDSALAVHEPKVTP